MGTWKKIKNELLITWSGLQEATTAIAERTNRQVIDLKHNLAIYEVEEEIKNSITALGDQVYRKGEVSLDDLKHDTAMASLVSDIKGMEKRIQLLRHQIKKDPSDSAGHLQRILNRGHYTLSTATVSDHFEGIGIPVTDIDIPPGMQIILVDKKGEVRLLTEATIIEKEDQVLFICEQKKQADYISFFSKA